MASYFIDWNKPIFLDISAFSILLDGSPLVFTEGSCVYREFLAFLSPYEDFGELRIDSSELEQFTPTLHSIPSSRCKIQNNFQCIECIPGFTLNGNCGRCSSLILDPCHSGCRSCIPSVSGRKCLSCWVGSP